MDRLPGQGGTLPFQFGHEVLLHGFANVFRRMALLQLGIQRFQGALVAGAKTVLGFAGLGVALPSGHAVSGWPREEEHHQHPHLPRPRAPGEEPRGCQFDVSDVLVQHLDVLLVVERHAPSAGLSGVHLQREGRGSAGHVFGAKRIEIRGFHAGQGVGARRARDGDKLEGAAAPFALRSDVDLVFHFGVKHLEFGGPNQLRLLEEFQVAAPPVGDLHSDRFVGVEAVEGSVLGDGQFGEGAQRIGRRSFWQRQHFQRHRFTCRRQFTSLKEVDPHVSHQIEVFQLERPRLLWECHDFSDGGHVVALAVDELGFPTCVRHVHGFLPKTVELWDVVVPNVEVVVPVVNLVVQHDRLSEVQGSLAGFNGSDQISGGLPLCVAVAVFRCRTLGTA